MTTQRAKNEYIAYSEWSEARYAMARRRYREGDFTGAIMHQNAAAKHSRYARFVRSAYYEFLACKHDGTFSFGCNVGVTRCDKCGKMFGMEHILITINADEQIPQDHPINGPWTTIK